MLFSKRRFDKKIACALAPTFGVMFYHQALGEANHLRDMLDNSIEIIGI